MTNKEVKLFYKSKVFWVNVVGVAVIALQMLLTTNTIVDPEIQALVLAVINILLRFKTNDPIRLK